MFVTPHFALKEGVNVAGLKTEMVPVLLAAYSVFAQHSVPFTITSALDSKHGRGSLHYVGLAIDIRRREIADPAVVQRIADEMKAALGSQYDVVVEKTHFHVEFQPK